MQGAVEKRRTTLANKKAEKAASTPVDASVAGQTTDSGSVGPSDPATPVSLPGSLPGQPGPLAMPQEGHVLLQVPPQPQGMFQQSPFGYAMSPGPHGPMG